MYVSASQDWLIPVSPSHLLLLLRTHTITTLFSPCFSVAANSISSTTLSRALAFLLSCCFRQHCRLDRPSDLGIDPSACETCPQFPCHPPTFIDTFLRVGYYCHKTRPRSRCRYYEVQERCALSLPNSNLPQSIPSPTFLHLPHHFPQPFEI